MVLQSGAYPETFLDASVIADALRESGKDLSQRWPVDHHWLDLRVVANATNFEELIGMNFDKDLRELVDLRLVGEEAVCLVGGVGGAWFFGRGSWINALFANTSDHTLNNLQLLFPNNQPNDRAPNPSVTAPRF